MSFCGGGGGTNCLIDKSQRISPLQMAPFVEVMLFFAI